MKLNMKKLGDNIATARKQIGLTQQQLADAIGVARPRVAEWETGVMTDMMLSSFLPLAALLSDEPDQLLADAVEPETIYLVRDDADGDMWTTFHRTLEAANDEASDQWSSLTKDEQAKRHVYVLQGLDTDPHDCAGVGYDVPEGGFDSAKAREEDRMKVFYRDGDEAILVATVLTNLSLTVEEALEAAGIDMDEYADEHGWDGWDHEALEMEY